MLMWLCSLRCRYASFAARASAREQCVRESSSVQPYRCGTHWMPSFAAALGLLVSYMTLAPSAAPKKSLIDTQKRL